ncbi:MAG: glycogen/starch/alpha-glucan phosphorylase, partial [Okeania sp. SIO2H7]|nr:glycogen/starch/alpha-glucan phosphorylase [Okeania sp. SIO2H7]
YCQQAVGQAYRNSEHWTRMSILNAARTGKFSSDRSIEDYCKTIWNVDPISIDLMDQQPANASELDGKLICKLNPA